MKEGIVGGAFNVLSETDLHRVHSASISLLEKQGVVSKSDLILQTFQKGGANVDVNSGQVRLPPEMVDAALESAPNSYLFYGRDPAMDILLESGRVYYGMGGGSEPYFWDYDLGQPRTPTKADMVACTRLGQALPNIDFVMALCSARDVPEEQSFFHEYEAIFRNTTKPVIYSAPGRRLAARFLEMAAAACGGEIELRRRPWVAFFVTPVSPLQITPLEESIFEAAPFNIPVLLCPGPMMGATSPATVAGNLVQTNAEALFVLVLSQLIKPGSPVIYSPMTPAMDMRIAQCTYGSAEQALGRVAVAQLGRFYNLPSFGTGASEAKLPDAAAASEAMMSMLLNALSGLTMTQTLGTLSSGLYGSQEMLLICHEMVHMIKRIMGGITITDETLALDVIDEVGPGGHFLDHDHTVRMFREELFFPILFQRQSIEQWLEAGARPIVDVAHERAQEILANSGPVPLPPGADEALERVLREAIEESERI
jgi:trimethylamine--corrinoid protein Co-methyltransferase